MEFKGTKGEREVFENYDLNFEVRTDRNEYVAEFGLKEDALLDAAAPELLEALQNLLSEVDKLDTHQMRGLISVQFEAREAINKALKQ